MDFWGPLPNGEHMLVMIYEYSRYPTVDFVNSTAAKAVIPHIDKSFSTHVFPETVKTDGGPPFNGTDSHDYKMYMKWEGARTNVVSPEDPEANGLAENFMKVITKKCHIAKIEEKNPKQEVNKFLSQYRATPHTTTGKPLAEVLFNRPFRTRLPEFLKPALDQDIRMRDEHAKQIQKMNKENKRNVRPHNIHIGDTVLLLQNQSKSNPRYDTTPYEVISVEGTKSLPNKGKRGKGA